MQDFLLALPVLLFSMVAHEYAHGYAALNQGDDTAYTLGRLTLNPLAFFNLIPIPPLDGSHLFYHLLPPALGAQYRALTPFGFPLLMILMMISPRFLGFFLYPAHLLRSTAYGIIGPYSLQTASVW